MKKASDLFIECLEEEGVEYIFGVPGEENLDFLDSLSRSKKIKLILTRHEQGAGFMAATYGRHTGKTGVCLATLGPGATNFVTAAAYAQLGGMPMMMITGQKPIKKSKQGRFQILDVVAMMGTDHQIYAPNGLVGQYPEPRARGLSPGRGRKARRGAYRTARGYRRRTYRKPAAEAQPFAPPDRRRQIDPRGGEGARKCEVAGAGDRRGREPHDDQPDVAAVHRKDRHSLSDYPARQGRDRRTASEIPRVRGAVGRRFRAPRGRGFGLHRQHRSRCDRKAALLHAARRTNRHPCVDQDRRRSIRSISPASRSSAISPMRSGR